MGLYLPTRAANTDRSGPGTKCWVRIVSSQVQVDVLPRLDSNEFAVLATSRFCCCTDVDLVHRTRSNDLCLASFCFHLMNSRLVVTVPMLDTTCSDKPGARLIDLSPSHCH